MLRRTLMLLALGAIAFVPASSALASSSALSDCSRHGRLTQHYTVGQLQTALNTMPADVQEYSNCYTVIHNQILAQIPGHHASAVDSAGGGDSFLPTPVIVVIVVLALGGATAGAVAIRRRGSSE